MSERITPCYVIGSQGVGYEDEWAYGPSEWLGHASDWSDVKAHIKADIRRHWTERNGIPIYTISDHGNEERVRSIRLRRR